MCYNYTGSKFRLSMPYFSVGIIFGKNSIAHPLQGLGDIQGRVIIVLSMHTPNVWALCKHKKLYMCDIMGQ